MKRCSFVCLIVIILAIVFLSFNSLVSGEYSQQDSGNKIYINEAAHLDSNRTFISDIYDEVREQDWIWSDEISDGEFVRVVFEENLTSERDVTVFPRTVSGTPRIEVYEVNGSEIVASFESLVDDELNTVYLDGSSGAGLGDREQDVFDLLILDGDVEFDWIVDPLPPPYIVLNTPANVSEFSRGIFNILLNTTVYDDNAEGIDVSLYGGNASAIDYGNNLLYQVFNVSNGTEVVYNWTASPAVPDANSVLLLHFDNRSAYGENSSYVVDFSGYGNNGTTLGGAFLNTTGGKFAGAIHFNGSGSYLNLSDPSSLDFDNMGNYTWSAWVSLDELGRAQYIFDKRHPVFAFSNYQILVNINNVLEMGSGFAGDYPNSTTVLTTDRFYHVAVSMNTQDNLSLYVDGVLEDTGSGTFSDLGSGTFSYISSPVAGFNGTIDEAVIWNRTLNAAEIRDLYRLNVDNYFWKVNVSDESGNSNESETFEFNISNVVDLTSCVILSEPGNFYRLTQNVNSGCNITASNVVFDGQGFNINGGPRGVSALNVINVSVKNLNITNAESGIYFEAVNDSHILNNSISFVTEGIFLQDVFHSTVANTSVFDAPLAEGIELFNSVNNSLLNNTLQQQSVGFRLADAVNNTFADNVIYNSTNFGVFLSSSSNSNAFSGGTINLSSTALRFTNSDDNNFTNISIVATSDTGYDFNLDSDSSGSRFIDMSHLGNYSLSASGVTLSVIDSTFGEIKFLEAVNGSGTNFTNDVRIGNNLAVVEIGNNLGLNRSANITLYGTPGSGLAEPELLRDGTGCGDVCFNLSSLTESIVVFNVSGWSNYSVGDVTFPGVTIHFPVEGGNYSASDLPLNFNVSLNENGSVLYSLDGGVNNFTMFDGVHVVGQYFNATNGSIADGSYVFSVYANDSAGNLNYTENVSFSVDQSIPLVAIVYPEVQNYTVNVSELNYTASDAQLDSCWYSTDSGSTNVSISCTANASDLISSEGSNAWVAYANDSSGNENSSSVSFSKDSADPAVQLTFPANDSSVESALVYFAANVSDSNALVNATLMVWNASSLVAVNSTNITGTSNITNLSLELPREDTYLWNYLVVDDFDKSVFNESNFTFVYSEPVSSGGGSSGGGGGGGGGGGSSFASGTFATDKDFIRSILMQGGTQRVTFFVTNTGSSTITITLDRPDLSGGLLRLSESSIVLAPGQSKEVAADFVAREDELPNVYAGSILLRGGGTSKKIDVVLEVLGKEPLFDVVINLQENAVDLGDVVSAIIEISNFGELEDIDLFLYYDLRNFDGDVIVPGGEENFAIGKRISISKQLQVPEDIAPGKYLFYARARYADIEASGSRALDVGTVSFAPALGNLQTILWFVVAIGFLMILVILTKTILLIRRRKKKQEIIQRLAKTRKEEQHEVYYAE